MSPVVFHHQQAALPQIAVATLRNADEHRRRASDIRTLLADRSERLPDTWAQVAVLNLLGGDTDPRSDAAKLDHYGFNRGNR